MLYRNDPLLSSVQAIVKALTKIEVSDEAGLSVFLFPCLTLMADAQEILDEVVDGAIKKMDPDYDKKSWADVS
jgi:hypothetical protein